MAFCLEEQKSRNGFEPQKLEKCYIAIAPPRLAVPILLWEFRGFRCIKRKPQERPFSLRVKG